MFRSSHSQNPPVLHSFEHTEMYGMLHNQIKAEQAVLLEFFGVLRLQIIDFALNVLSSGAFEAVAHFRVVKDGWDHKKRF
jgi:hypothetical protein